MSDRAASSIYVRGACGYNRNLDQGEACSAAIRSKTFATFQTESPVAFWYVHCWLRNGFEVCVCFMINKISSNNALSFREAKST